MSHLRQLKRPMLWALTGSVALCFPFFDEAILPLYRNSKLQPEKTAIVTGASGNLGTAIAYNLAKRQVRVIMACRDLEKCKLIRREIALLTGHKGLACRQLDLENIDSINKFVDNIIATEPHIDILVNNAAVKNVDKKEITKYGVEKNYFVNFLAPFLLTFRLMDKLKESAKITRDSRIINVIGTPKKSWDVDIEDINFDSRVYNAKTAYEQSKMALAYFTILLNQFNRDQANHVYVYGTSPCSKRMLKSLDRPVTAVENLKAIKDVYIASSPDRAVGSVIRCAIHPNFGNLSTSGKLYTYFHQSFGWGKAGKDEIKAKLVWNSALRTLFNIKD